LNTAPRKLTGPVVLAAATVSLIAIACQATVYWPRGLTGKTTPGADDGRIAYATSVDINGGKGEMKISGVDAAFDTVVERLRVTVFAGHEKSLAVGDGLAFGFVRNNDVVVRILATEIGNRCVVFRLEQTPAEFSRSRKPSTSRILGSLPAFPGSITVLSAGDSDRGTAMEISRANSDPGTIHAYIGSGLRRDGWIQVPGATSSPAGVAAAVYARGKEICCVLVRKRAASESESLISMVIKQNKEERRE